MNAVYRNKSGEEVAFSRDTLRSEIPRDDSRNAVVEPQVGEPLSDVRRDAMSIQYQINEFLTSRMKSETKRAKPDE